MPDKLPNAPRKMVRLAKAGWIIKALATLFVIAFLCAYLNIFNRYGTPQTQARTVHPHPSFLASVFHPTPPSRAHHHPTFRRVNRRMPRRIHRTSFYHLASLRRLHHLFSDILDVRS